MKLKKKYRLYLSQGDIDKAEGVRNSLAHLRSDNCPIAQSVRRHLKPDRISVAGGFVWIGHGEGSEYLLSKNGVRAADNFDNRLPVLPTHFTITQS